MNARRLLVLAFALLLPWRAAGSVERVVSLNLCTDQWLVLLAPEKAVGLSALARDPALSFVAERAAQLPMVRTSAEAVMALHPDLILGARFGARTTLALLERAGFSVVRIDLPTDLPGIRTALRETAALLGVPERAEPLIAAMDAAIPPARPGPHVAALLVMPENDAGPSLATEMLAHTAVRGIPILKVPSKLTICAGPFTAEAVRRLAQ
jgi:iron complex transport system substrate-binding protein